MIVYYKLDALLEKRQIKKIELQKKLGAVQLQWQISAKTNLFPCQ